MHTNWKHPLFVALVAFGVVATTSLAEAQPGYYTYDIYGGRFNGAAQPAVVAQPLAIAPVPAPVAANVAFGARPVATTVAYGNACNPCAAPVQHTVGYTPVTTYRWGFTRTAYRPVTTADACGNAVTQVEAYKTLLPRFTRIPVTTYRPTPMLSAAPVVAAPATVSYAQPAAYAAPAGCSSCSAGTSSVVQAGGSSLPTPALRPIYESYPQSKPVLEAPQYESRSYNGQSYEAEMNPRPAEVQRPETRRDSTFDSQHESRMKALPPVEPAGEVESSSAPQHRVPQLLDPSDKTASRAPLPAVHATPVVYTASQPARSAPQLDDSGWQSER